MDNPPAMGLRETPCDLNRDIDRLIYGQWPAGDLLLQRLSLVILHDDEHLTARRNGIGRAVLCLVDVMNHADVVVLQGRSRFRFMDKPVPGFGISGQFRRQEFEGDGTIELEVLGLVDNAHAPAAEFLKYLIVGDRCADHRDSLLNHVSGMYPASTSFNVPLSLLSVGRGWTRWVIGKH